ncbi:hypothetical protein [Streptomyces sp. NBC_00233]|uniref:hypothetical protein n=1 Tax=Streptomyces sp. NBC_00233 TaxID=2975686 RepID=UPI00225607E9|nr:hypothetical protein [Streptomyces sp. NBC_00233]MCX5232967.1 hypothetical protein [Streptomyces sp. NBC_00233]
MQYLVHPLGGVCFPSPLWPAPQWPDGFGPAARRLVAKVRRYAANAAKLATYAATGTGTAFTGLAAGLSPAEAISLGLNAAGTTAALWPLAPLPPVQTGNQSEAVTDASN